MGKWLNKVQKQCILLTESRKYGWLYLTYEELTLNNDSISIRKFFRLYLTYEELTQSCHHLRGELVENIQLYLTYEELTHKN